MKYRHDGPGPIIVPAITGDLAAQGHSGTIFPGETIEVDAVLDVLDLAPADKATAKAVAALRASDAALEFADDAEIADEVDEDVAGSGGTMSDTASAAESGSDTPAESAGDDTEV